MATRFVTNPRRPSARKPAARRRNPSDIVPGLRIGKYTVEQVRKNDVIVREEGKRGDGDDMHRIEATTLADLKRALARRDEAKRAFYAAAMPEHSYAWNPRRRLGGVEAIYAGRIAGKSIARDEDGVEYVLDPEEIAESGVKKGDALVVRAVPGRFATFRRTVRKTNPRRSTRYPKMARLQALRDLMDGDYSRRKVKEAGLTSRPPKAKGDTIVDQADYERWVGDVVVPAYREAEQAYWKAGGLVDDRYYRVVVGAKEGRNWAKDLPKFQARKGAKPDAYWEYYEPEDFESASEDEDYEQRVTASSDPYAALATDDVVFNNPRRNPGVLATAGLMGASFVGGLLAERQFGYTTRAEQEASSLVKRGRSRATALAKEGRGRAEELVSQGRRRAAATLVKQARSAARKIGGSKASRRNPRRSAQDPSSREEFDLRYWGKNYLGVPAMTRREFYSDWRESGLSFTRYKRETSSHSDY